jgi:hypothetical protein
MHRIRGGIGLIAFVSVLLAGELGYRSLVRNEETLADEPLDIQSPNQLIVKLEYLRKFDGTKIVLIGDSIVYGGVLKDFGDQQWREHTLTALLREKYAAQFPSKKVLVMNLGINGALPEDTERIVRLVGACKVDALIFSTHLRPFAADFDTDREAMARPWLRNIEVAENGGFHDRSTGDSWSSRVNRGVLSLISERSRFFRDRDTLHAMLPRAVHSKVETDRMIGLMQIQRRFESVRLDANHRQLAALRRTLAYMQAEKIPSIYFYVKENPDDVDVVIDPEDHWRHYSQLVHFFHEFGGADVAFIPPLAELESRHFLDFSHVNHEGYAILTDHLWDALLRMEARHD